MQLTPPPQGAGEAAFSEFARAAIQSGREEAAAGPVAAAARAIATSPRLWQFSALLHRALDQHVEALAAFDRAAALAPADASIAHGRAHTALEAGVPAVALFETARRLAPGNGDTIFGLAAARFETGDGAGAVAELRTVLAANPRWIAGHQKLAELCWMLGTPDVALASFDAALAANPRDPALWQGLIATLTAAERYDEMLQTVRRGRAALGESPWFDANEAIALSELGEHAAAERLFACTVQAEDPALHVRFVRHLLRTGRADDAAPWIDRGLAGQGAALFWPYAATCWRLLGDARWDWLEGDERLISVIDLTPSLPPLDRLAELLRSIHRAREQHLNQSVRGGTQTDGPLFRRLEPEIRTLRSAIVAAVEAHVAQLPPPDPRHPALSPRRDLPVRFSGSWSVRLRGAGHHINHWHPQGWISSALYVSLPQPGEGDAGWLIFGEPQADLGIGLAPFRKVEPKPGQLVLFPSTMWHGTVPFADGERLTVAFDVAARG